MALDEKNIETKDITTSSEADTETETGPESEDADNDMMPYEGRVLVPTVFVKVQAGVKSDYIRGVMSWGSTLNLISDKCRKKFDLPLIEGEGMPSAYGVGNTGVDILGATIITISPHFNNRCCIELEVFVADKISPMIASRKLHPMVKEHLRNYNLADPLFDESGDIDLLLGVTLYPVVMKEQRHIIPGTTCYVFDSHLGWVVMGRAPVEGELQEDSLLQSFLCLSIDPAQKAEEEERKRIEENKENEQRDLNLNTQK